MPGRLSSCLCRTRCRRCSSTSSDDCSTMPQQATLAQLDPGYRHYRVLVIRHQIRRGATAVFRHRRTHRELPARCVPDLRRPDRASIARPGAASHPPANSYNIGGGRRLRSQRINGQIKSLALFAGQVAQPRPSITVITVSRSLGTARSCRASTHCPPAWLCTTAATIRNVVSVSRNGLIHTVGSGVATVTATVEYHGRTATGSFVIDVQ